MDIFNELIFTISIYICISICGFDTELSFKSFAGWTLVVLFIFSIGINLIVIVNSIFREIRFKII
jgi:hypothetical protein